MMRVSICPKCGFDNPPGMRFCGNCGQRLPKTVPVPDEKGKTGRLGTLVGADLLERLRQAGIEAAGQRRNVTVLFVDLVNFTTLSGQIEDETLYHLLQKFLGSLADQVYNFEGIVDKYTGDGLMALFGAPIAHENNAERAVRAALGMQAGVARLQAEMKADVDFDLKARIGLHAGSVIVGQFGSNMLMDYTAVGDTVNLARRLEEHAEPGTIFVSEAVYRKTKALFDYEAHPPLQLKGFADPVKAYQAVGLKHSPGLVRGLEGLRAPLIGRDRELRLLRQVAQSLQERNQGQFVLVTGEAGIGKSRLTAELKASVDAEKIRILEGQSLTYRQSISYWIFIDLLRNSLGVTMDTPPEQVGKLLAVQTRAALGAESAAEALPYLEYILALPPSDPIAAERISYLDAEQLRQKIFLTVRDLLVAWSNQRPLMIILEDLHWADESSLDLLNFILDTVSKCPLLLYGISRPFQSGTLKKIVEQARALLGERFYEISLQNLLPHQSQQLFYQLLKVPELPENLHIQIVQRASGVPFYLEEILRMLIEEQVIEYDDGHWRAVPDKDFSTVGVPDTLQELILTRFDRLGHLERKVLQVAGIIGREFSLPVLKIVLKGIVSEVSIRVAMSTLREREFILPRFPGALSEFIFKHVLTSDAIYGTMLKRERNVLHGQVGEAIEQFYADRLDSQVELLASHFLRSTKLDRALHYLILAGQKAARDYANEQARQHFEQALTLLSRVPSTPRQGLDIHMGLGDVLSLIGEYQAARSHYEPAFDAITGEDMLQYADMHSTLHRKVSITYERQGDYDRAQQCLMRAQRSLRILPSPPVRERAQILNDLGWNYFRRGSLDAAQENLTQALTLVESTTQYDVIASIYNRLGGVFFHQDALDKASDYVQKSLILREQIGDIVAVARSYNNLGLLHWRLGKWDDALDNFTHGLKLHATLGDVEGMAQLHSNIGLLQTDRGELDEAQHHLKKSLQGAQQVGHSFMEGLAYMHLTRFWLSAQEWEKSLEYSVLCLDAFKSIGARENNWANLYYCIGEAWLGLGDVQKAEQAGATAVELLQRSATKDKLTTPERGRILRLLGNIAKEQGDYPNAHQRLRESLEQFANLNNQLEIGRAFTALAFLAHTQNQKDKVVEYTQKAHAIFQPLGAKLDLREIKTLVAQY